MTEINRILKGHSQMIKQNCEDLQSICHAILEEANAGIYSQANANKLMNYSRMISHDANTMYNYLYSVRGGQK